MAKLNEQRHQRRTRIALILAGKGWLSSPRHPAGAALVHRIDAELLAPAQNGPDRAKSAQRTGDPGVRLTAIALAPSSAAKAN